MKALPLFSAALLMLAGCGYLAEHTAKIKSAGTTRSQQALAADQLFWATFHGGKYEERCV